MFLLYVSSVFCGSLREEFTWTRISYVGRNGRHGNRPSDNNNYTPIIFPGDVNVPQTSMSSAGPQGNDYIFGKFDFKIIN